MSIYGRLGFNFAPANTEILSLSTDSQAHLNSMPRFMKDWQIEDIGDNNVGGYFRNPVANVYTTIAANTTIIYTLANTDPANTWVEGNLAQDLANTAAAYLIELTAFKSHTDNVSGVNDIQTGGDAAAEFPYFDTATGMGKFLIYLTHESDGVLNNSPIIGSMTSLFIETELQGNNSIVVNDLQTINSSFAGGLYTLTGAQINTIISHIQTANSYIGIRKNHDITFFRNCKDVVDDYSSVNRFSNMGETNTRLLTEYNGTDKIVTRLNS